MSRGGGGGERLTRHVPHGAVLFGGFVSHVAVSLW